MYVRRMFGLSLLSLGLACGCSGPPRTTRMTLQDYTEISGEMAAKLGNSQFLAERTTSSPRMVIAIRKIENLSSDMIPAGAQWYMQTRVVESVPMTEWSRDKNIAFTIPADRLREARRYGEVNEAFATQRKPTHVMTAIIRSITRTADKDRTDLYYCEYQITDLASGGIVWADKVEFKRLAEGIAWD